MPVIINASSTSGLVISNDMSGTLQFQQNGVNLPMSGLAPAFSAYLSSNQTITTTTWTKVQCGTEEFDTNSNYDTSNYRFTPTVAGYYQVSGRIDNGPSTSPSQIYTAIYKNGGGFKYGSAQALTAAQYGQAANVSALVYLNGTTDYVELYGYIAASTAVIQSGLALGFFQGVLIRGA